MMQLRYLQTLAEIGVEKNTTIVFPLPMDVLSMLRDVVTQGTPQGKVNAGQATVEGERS